MKNKKMTPNRGSRSTSIQRGTDSSSAPSAEKCWEVQPLPADLPDPQSFPLPQPQWKFQGQTDAAVQARHEDSSQRRDQHTQVQHYELFPLQTGESTKNRVCLLEREGLYYCPQGWHLSTGRRVAMQKETPTPWTSKTTKHLPVVGALLIIGTMVVGILFLLYLIYARTREPVTSPVYDQRRRGAQETPEEVTVASTSRRHKNVSKVRTTSTIGDGRTEAKTSVAFETVGTVVPPNTTATDSSSSPSHSTESTRDFRFSNATRFEEIV